MMRRFYKELAENSSEVILVVNKKGMITYVSSSIEHIMGYQSRELIGRSVFKFIHPEDVSRALVDFGKSILMKDTAIPNSFRVLHKDCSVRTLEGFGKNLLQHPVIAGFVMNIHDITECIIAKEAEKNYIREQMFLSKMATGFITLSREDNIYTFIAENLRKLIGNCAVTLSSFSEASGYLTIQSIVGVGRRINALTKLLGKHPIGMSIPIDNEGRTGLVRGVLTKIPGGLYELSMGTLSQTICNAIEGLLGIGDTYAIGFSWQGQSFASAVIIMYKGTTLGNTQVIETFVKQGSIALQDRQIEEALLKSEEKYRSLVESSEDTVYLVDIDLKYLHANRSLLSRYGKLLNEVIGKRYRDFHSPEKTEEFSKKIAGIIESGKPEIYEHISQLDDRFFLRTLSPKTGVVSAVTVFSKDITERKRVENSLKTSKKVLQKLRERLQTVVDNERTRIAREIHDDIGQSLTGLSMDLALLQRELDKPDEAIRNSLIQTKLNEMNTAVNSLVGRVREIATELRLEVLDDLGLSAAIRWKVREFKERTALNYRLIFNPMDISMEPKINSFLFRIFTEAMTNIVRHAEAQNVEIAIEQKTQSLLLQIVDDGKGTNKHLLESSKSLGIYSMREYAEAIGARFKISSQLRKGTSITVELPLEKVES